jgi:hypothetical protein
VWDKADTYITPENAEGFRVFPKLHPPEASDLACSRARGGAAEGTARIPATEEKTPELAFA